MTDSRLREQQRRAATDPGEGERFVRLTCRAEGHDYATPPRYVTFPTTPLDWDSGWSNRKPYKPRVDFCKRCYESVVRAPVGVVIPVDYLGKLHVGSLLLALAEADYEEYRIEWADELTGARLPHLIDSLYRPGWPRRSF